MPPLDLKRLFEEERARRRLGTGASTSAEPPPAHLETLEPRPPLRLSDHDVGRNAPRPVEGLHYVPDFVTEAEERSLLLSIRAEENAGRWTAGDGGRSVANWGGRPSDATVTEPLPSWGNAIVDAFFRRKVFEHEDGHASLEFPNHVLVNQYRAPCGIFPHNDGSVYAPRVAILSLEGDALIDFWENDRTEAVVADPDDWEGRDAKDVPEPRAQVMLRPRSLLVYRDDAYRLRHGIRRSRVDVVGDACVNATSAGVVVGETVARGTTRVSVVFVIKTNG
jgi:alkylated DNA repair protein alkB family protein 6